MVTNSLVQSDPEGCFKIIMENYSLNSVHLSWGQDVGVLELVTFIPVEGISSVQDLQLRADGTEESVLLCNVQPRVDTLIKEIPIYWERLGSSDGAKLQLLIEEYADVFALDSSEVGRTEVVEHSIDTLSHAPTRQAPCRISFSLRAPQSRGSYQDSR